MVKGKGILDLVEAFSIAASQDKRLVCLMIGSYPSLDETHMLQNFINQQPSSVRDRIKVLPACESDRIWEFLCATDIFAFPSYREGMPNSLLEAMAIGIPAVAFGIPPILEINQKEMVVLIVEPFDRELFGEAILSLARNPKDREGMGQLARVEVRKRFMVKENMAEVVKHLQKTQIGFRECEKKQEESPGSLSLDFLPDLNIESCDKPSKRKSV